jgi:PTH1 family peptidyl-tRNA hydrolase
MAASPRVRLVVGLGNPGAAYQGTRHNLGFRVLHKLAQEEGLSFARQGAYQGEVAHWRSAYGEVVLLLPWTYMNRSGASVAAATQRLGLGPQQVLVVCDDLDLPLGRVRVRPHGSSGGHNGLRSITEALGSQDFGRVRVGIGRPPHGDAVAYVLGRFAPGELALVETVVGWAVEAVRLVVAEGYEAAMQAINGRIAAKGDGG